MFGHFTRLIIPFLFLFPFSNNAQNSEWVILNEGNSNIPTLPEDMDFDEDNEVWMATYEGLLHYDRNDFTHYDSSNSPMPVDQVNGVAVDADGDKWIGTGGGGLVHFDGNAWEVYNSSNSGLPSDALSEVEVDEDGNKWISLGGNGLVKFDGSTWVHYHHGNSGLPDHEISSISLDLEGDLWAGTYGGLVEFDGDDWELYTSANSDLPTDEISQVENDDNGTTWVGIGFTYPSLTSFDGTDWTLYDEMDSEVLENIVTGIAVEYPGKVWVSTLGSGVLAIEDGELTEYRSGQTHLPDDHVTGIHIGEWYNKWMVSDGIAIYRSEGVPVTEHPAQKSFSQRVHPNPFRERTRFEFEFQEARKLSLRIRDVHGRIVRHFVDRRKGAGEQRLIWDGRNESGMQVSDGIYFYEGRVGEERFSGKLVKAE